MKKWTTLLSGRRKWVLAGVVALVVAVLVLNSVAGKDLRVWWILRSVDDDAEDTGMRLKALGEGYRGALGRAVLRGGRDYDTQYGLCRIALDEPYFLTGVILECLESDDPMVWQPATEAILGAERRAKGLPLRDGVLAALAKWAETPHDPYLANGISSVRGYYDRRLIDVLLPILLLPVDDQGTDALAVGRTNASREATVAALADYNDDPRVRAAFNEVVSREKEVDLIQVKALKATLELNIEALWRMARSANAQVRQYLAAYLEEVNDPRVIPILVFLTEDVHEIVRRGALGSLIVKRSPVVMENLLFWAEDEYPYIRGDLAQCLDHYRREEFIPFLIWCLTDGDRQVVEKSIVTLFRITGKNYGFEEVWDRYTWDRHLEGGAKGKARSQIIKDFINSEERKTKAVARWREEFPPTYGDEERVPHLIRQLGHQDFDNVRRAIRELNRIRGWTDCFPPEVLDVGAEVQAEADAIYTFMQSDREKLIEELLER